MDGNFLRYGLISSAEKPKYVSFGRAETNIKTKVLICKISNSSVFNQQTKYLWLLPAQLQAAMQPEFHQSLQKQSWMPNSWEKSVNNKSSNLLTSSQRCPAKIKKHRVSPWIYLAAGESLKTITALPAWQASSCPSAQVCRISFFWSVIIRTHIH